LLLDLAFLAGASGNEGLPLLGAKQRTKKVKVKGNNK